MKLAAACFAPLLSLSVVSTAPAIATARPLGAWAEHLGIMAQASGTGTGTLHLDPPPDATTERPQHPREVPPVVVRRSKIGFGVVGGVAAAAGIGVIIAGSIQARNARDCTKDYRSCAIALSHGVTNRGAGVLVLGTGLGLIVGILPWMAKGAGARKKAWIAQTVIGGAFAAAGLIVLGATRPAFIDALVAGETTDKGLKDVNAASNVAGNLMFGLGSGTAISAITNLIVQHHHLSKVEMSASVARGQFGLMLSGRF